MATYEEVKDIKNTPEKLLIDVRNSSELEEFGKIPGCINIPLPELGNALELGSNEFKEKYNIEKPNKNKVIIFSCRSGARSQRATDLAQTLGFKNAKNYGGSWLEWCEKEKL